MTERRAFRAFVHAGGLSLIAAGAWLCWPMLTFPSDSVDLLFRLGLSAPAVLIGLYFVARSTRIVRVGYPVQVPARRRAVAKPSSEMRLFGVVIRVIGLGVVLCAMKGLWGLALTRFAGAYGVVDISPSWQVASNAISLLGGLYLLRGAPHVLRFSYPSDPLTRHDP